ncbi:hypothetical protein JZ751_019733 [Albula glossodonta]|uniref:Ig-like domain-containing protein n=1 Tax=Albula glossodonta TaxID=121402 RepID=A0A8T2MVJ9_9TELE|nr:hypothetical protein JZ751_019733 [Albula glossodonta]
MELSDSAVYYCALRPTVTVKCSPSLQIHRAVNAYSVHWYRQYPGSKPEFRILILEAKDGEVTERGLTVEHERKSKRVHLKLSSVKVTDSALYYCALQPTLHSESVFLAALMMVFCVFILLSVMVVTDSALYYCALRPTVTGNP